jgi:hypothetical protein
MEMPITLSGINPATFRLAARWFNQLSVTFVAHKINIASLLLHHLLFCMRVCLYVSDFSGLVVSMLASGTQVRGFKPG